LRTSTRGKILAQTTLRLRYGTSAQTTENPEIETGTSRVRLVDFGVRHWARTLRIRTNFGLFEFLELSIGSSLDNIRSTAKFTVTGKTSTVKGEDRAFLSAATVGS
jgi:hypothetical protein